MARINLVPQRKEFFQLFNQASANAVAISRALVDLLAQAPNGSQERIRDIKDLEHEGDRLTHEVVNLLNRTFVTPFDRDDMYRLAGAADDICDHVDEAAGNIVGYGVKEIRPAAKAQGDVILRAASKLQEAVARLEGFKDSSRQLIELRDLEDEGGHAPRGRARRGRGQPRGCLRHDRRGEERRQGAHRREPRDAADADRGP